MMNNRNINASGKPETISTTRRRNEAAALLREKRDQARQRFSALEARLKDFSNANVSYVSVNGDAGAQVREYDQKRPGADAPGRLPFCANMAWYLIGLCNY